jgi:monovalent cation/proton antiporter MnhG/PhaG subunit
MTAAQWIIAVLLGISVLLTFLCCLGMVVMRDAYQRLQFTTPVISIAAVCITIAVWMHDDSWGSRLKMVCIALVLFWMNSILCHATARAIRIRQHDQLEPARDEKIPVVREKKS